MWARVHTVCPLAAHGAICLKEEEILPRLGMTGPASPYHRKAKAARCPRLALKDTRVKLWCGRSSPLLPHDNEDQLLSTGDRILRKASTVSREGSQSWVFALSASHPMPQQQPRPYHHPLHILLSISLEPWLTPNLWRTIKSYFYRKLFHRKCLVQKTKMPYKVSLFSSPLFLRI